MFNKMKGAWVLELDDTFGRYVLGLYENLEDVEEYVSSREVSYDVISQKETRIYRNGNGVRYVASFYEVR